MYCPLHSHWTAKIATLKPGPHRAWFAMRFHIAILWACILLCCGHTSANSHRDWCGQPLTRLTFTNSPASFAEGKTNHTELGFLLITFAQNRISEVSNSGVIHPRTNYKLSVSWSGNGQLFFFSPDHCSYHCTSDSDSSKPLLSEMAVIVGGQGWEGMQRLSSKNNAETKHGTPANRR